MLRDSANKNYLYVENLTEAHPNDPNEGHPNVHRDGANKKPIYVENLHEPQPNVHRPFWGVSGLEKPGCTGSEPRDVSVRLVSSFSNKEYKK